MPIMRWLKTMKSIKYLALLVLLIKCIRLIDATPTTPVSASSSDGDATVATSSTISSSSSSSSSSTTSTNNRERSTKVSSERIKASLHNEEASPLNATLLPSRRVASGRARDNKLMSVLQARRRAPSRWRSAEECERHCRTSSNDEFCKLKCSRDMKLIRNGSHNNKNIQTASESSDVNEMSTSDLNLVQSNGDEFLDTEESVHGLYFADPSNNLTSSTSNKQTKESLNLIGSSSGKTINSPDSRKETRDKSNDDVSSPTTVSSTTKISRRNKYARTSLSPLDVRSTVYRGRVKFSPSHIEVKSLDEEIDADPYLYIGQKLAGTTNRTPDVRRQPSARRTPIVQSTTSRSKEEELEIMEVSVAKQSSTEKNKFWKTRNIVAINHYMRRLNPHISVSPIVTKAPEKIENTTKLTTVRYETIHSKGGQKVTSISAVNNLAEGTSDVKNVFSRSTINVNQTESPPKIPLVKTIYHPAGLPSLIINVPDDATPIFFNDHRNYEQSDGELESAPTDTADIIDTTTSPTSDPSLESELKYSSRLPDINRLFENITTTNANVVSSDQKTETRSTLESTVSSSTTTSVSKSIVSSTEAYIPMKTTKRVYTTIPRRKSTTVFPDYNKTTISTFLSNISSKRNKINVRNETTNVPASTTPRNSISSTISYKINRNTAKTSAPVDLEIVAPPSVTPESVTPPIQTNVFYQGISTTGKPQESQVLVEMYKMNTATYVMAGLGLLPLVVILIYVVRQYIYRHEHKHGDSENYGNDIQPISPVVTLDQSDDGGSIEGEGSIISETDFNRANLRFKSLLGEGNFGQVWKAEADNLVGHLGTTRIVAVKTERTNNGQGGLKAECEIMRKLGSHSNVVTLLGACVEQEPHLLIMEYAMRGRLLSLLRAARGVLNGLHHPPSRQPVMPLSPRRLTGFALDIARGMEYIAEKKIVHRDLAARNVLLDHNGICKICDFGMSIDLDKSKPSQGHMKIPRVSTYQNKFKFDMTARVFGGLKHYATSKTRSNCDTNKNRPALPIRWMAPEALQYHVYSVETDVFAYGIVLWELATLGITPYPTLSGREVLRGVPNGVRPEIPSSCRQELTETMTHCWHKDQNQRPSFTDVRKSLARALVQWQEEVPTNVSEYIDVSGFSEDYENGMIYFNRRVSEFECEI